MPSDEVIDVRKLASRIRSIAVTMEIQNAVRPETLERLREALSEAESSFLQTFEVKESGTDRGRTSS